MGFLAGVKLKQALAIKGGGEETLKALLTKSITSAERSEEIRTGQRTKQIGLSGVYHQSACRSVSSH